MTGLSETEHIIKGLEAGGVDYITKPIVPDELLARIRVHLANARLAHSARAALDAFGRFLLATSHTGRVLWYTPQAAKLLGVAFADFDREGYVLPRDVQEWLQIRCRAPPGRNPRRSSFKPRKPAHQNAAVSISARSAPDENLLRLLEGEIDDDRTCSSANSR